MKSFFELELDDKKYIVESAARESNTAQKNFIKQQQTGCGCTCVMFLIVAVTAFILGLIL